MEDFDAVLIEIEASLARARDAKDQIEEEETHTRSKRASSYEYPREAFAAHLKETEQLLEVVLEAQSLQGTRSRLIEKWANFETAGLGTTQMFQGEYLLSEPFDYLKNVIESLRLARGKQRSSLETYELAKFKSMLDRTAVLLHGRGIEPKNEHDIQNVMHDYLGGAFAEYRTDVHIPGIIKNFKPDGGVRNIKAAVEFKYADTHEKVSTALGGIFEDVSGYSGSADWTRFYSVVYQPEPFEAVEKFDREFKRIGAFTWTPILVTGPGADGKREPRNKRAGKK